MGNGKLKCICSYRVVRHVFSIKYLYTNCIHELEKSNHELVQESDAMNMDDKTLRHIHDNDAYAGQFDQNLFYSRDNTVM